MSIPHNIIMDSCVNGWKVFQVALTTTAVDVMASAPISAPAPFQVLLRSAADFLISDEETGVFAPLSPDLWFPLPAATQGQLWAKTVSGAAVLYVVVLGNYRV